MRKKQELQRQNEERIKKKELLQYYKDQIQVPSPRESPERIRISDPLGEVRGNVNISSSPASTSGSQTKYVADPELSLKNPFGLEVEETTDEGSALIKQLTIEE